MNTHQTGSHQRQLQLAYQELSSGHAQKALLRLQEHKKNIQVNTDVEHLIALCYKALNNLELSEKHFRASLSINSTQPEVLNNLANLLKKQKSYQSALEFYEQALSINPNYLQARRNQAICYQALSRYLDAVESYDKALAISASDVSSIVGKADCLRLNGSLEASFQLYKKAISLDQAHVNAWHNLGLNYHLQGELSQSITCYRKASQIAPMSPEVSESLAMALFESGDVSEAVSVFESAIDSNANNVSLHEKYNAMLWETSFSNQFGNSYAKAVALGNATPELFLSYASTMYRAGKADRAKSILESAYQYFLSSVQDGDVVLRQRPDFLSLEGQVLAEQGDHEPAYNLLSKSLNCLFDSTVARQMIKIDIIQKRYSQAQALLDRLFKLNQECQLSWGLQSLIWRLTGDDRYHWLCNYAEFVKSYEIDAPKSYASKAEFLADLEQELLVMHHKESSPLEQTLRNGTQTAARLLHTKSSVIEKLKSALTLIVKTYIDDLSDDENHPFLRRKTKEFEFSGSWSVSLKSNGFHVNHVHPEGWISSSCYIYIPKSTGNSISAIEHKPGCIKFGESPLQLGDRELIELSIEPKAGLVVLFPSYFWHGTIPFAGSVEDFRLTTPFDVLPLN